MLNLPGFVLALIEISIWFILAKWIRKGSKSLSQVGVLAYYWATFTILTGLWELAYLHNYDNVANNLAPELIKNHEHVWLKKYPITYILPGQFSQIFYAEYGAYADREYMSDKDTWSHFIEGTHWFICGFLCFIAMLTAVLRGVNSTHYSFSLGAAMMAQAMNSILYMAEYQIQVKQPYSVNYNTAEFPLGKFWDKRPFMWINILWTALPVFVSFLYLFNKEDEQKRKTTDNKLSISADDVIKETKINDVTKFV